MVALLRAQSHGWGCRRRKVRGERPSPCPPHKAKLCGPIRSRDRVVNEPSLRTSRSSPRRRRSSLRKRRALLVQQRSRCKSGRSERAVVYSLKHEHRLGVVNLSLRSRYGSSLDAQERRARPADRHLRGLRTAIQEGRLQQGSRLPSTRDFARQLGSRGHGGAGLRSARRRGYLSGRAARHQVSARSRKSGFRRAGARIGAAVARAPRSRAWERLARSPFPIELLPAPRRSAAHAGGRRIPGRRVGRLWRGTRAASGRSAARRRRESHRPLRRRSPSTCASTAAFSAAPIGDRHRRHAAVTRSHHRLLLDEGDAAWMEDPAISARDVLRAAGARSSRCRSMPRG